MELTVKEVVEEGYCIGCGACPFADPSIVIEKNRYGKYQAKFKNETSKSADRVCPFASSKRNEDILGKKIYGDQEGILHNNELGYFLETYIGYVTAGNYRMEGSSGGTANWIISKLFEENLIDAVVHVKDSSEKDVMYSFQISESIEELQKGAKSKYYPIEMSSVLKEIQNSDKRYAVVGIPCFIKAVRLLQEDFPDLRERIKYTVGLVCGHLKSDFFAKSEGWELGIEPDNLDRVDFRVKLPNRSASDYGVEARGRINNKEEVIVSPTRDLFTTNWGYGFFKYQACDYCDDVLSELADITVGDAWLPKYTADYKGTNAIIIRNKDILDLFKKYEDQIAVFNSTAEEIADSQAGGFRHRREGLKYRLWLKEQAGKKIPTKRVLPSDNIPENRKEIYLRRIKLIDDSFNAYLFAIEQGDFNSFKKKMKPMIKSYNKVSVPLRIRMKKKILKVIPNNLKVVLKKLK